MVAVFNCLTKEQVQQAWEVFNKIDPKLKYIVKNPSSNIIGSIKTPHRIIGVGYDSAAYEAVYITLKQEDSIEGLKKWEELKNTLEGVRAFHLVQPKGGVTLVYSGL